MKPLKYIILILASTAVAGKVQIAKSIASALSCHLLQGDSLHETAAKAANLGASRGPVEDNDSGGGGKGQTTPAFLSNEGRYQRMWLSKMTRTGLLFPEESRPANEGFSGFGGALLTSTSRRGSGSSIASASSDTVATASTASIASSFTSSGGDVPPPPSIAKYINKPVTWAPLPSDERLRRANPALMVVTHPELDRWHKDCIRKTVGEYRIGVIFVPLDEVEDDELPVLKPLDSRTMTSFASLGSFGACKTGGGGGSLEEEMVLRVNVDANVEHLIDEIVDGVRDLMGSEGGSRLSF
ncbi:hypothetical protein CGRA01v4_14100 [Colletotrichum graminicola]|uniref:Uncharacterized protein n=1 Tax=Colletotrichum graminicola (strain M1.001 / M2 / FGSC 10212) TaxID=645133 RepID=E3QUW9_COLGM|nr:uncharacterized protein GLRG_09801 [Colletotrichum graminicola M1.001]EFQ34657.1 hypothetical protein GLRG_09801 [Colletotrichum graminicola M1.001]WDK22810.1 hypothetical protein CGRA01v4_14100 [Colletotrichum graminicola]